MGRFPLFFSMTAFSAGFVGLRCLRHWKKNLPTVSPELSCRLPTCIIDYRKTLSTDSHRSEFRFVFL